MTPDRELLQHYAATNSEDAFAELVRRHVNLVYSAALRQVNGDEHLAHDVAQTVFTDLARKAGSLARHESLTGWLYTSAHFAAAKLVRGETRRRDREEKFMREPTNGSGMGILPVQSAPDTDWEKLHPVLDAAMHELKTADREAVLLRYFENRQFAEVGAKLGLNENAARMRVERAVEKLHGILTKRGLTTAGTLASVISANAVQLAPTGLAATLTTTSLATVGIGTFTFLKIMTATKLKLGISAILVASAATALVVQHQTQNTLRDENQLLQQQIAQLKTDNANFSNQLANVSDSKKLPNDQFNELLKLRGEVGVLQRQLGEIGKLRQENQRSQTAQLDTNALRQAIVDAEKQQQESMMQKLNGAKEGMLAFIMFAADNQNIFPTNFSQAATYLGNNADLVGTNFDIAYEGSVTNISNPPAAIVLKEKQAWQTLTGKWMKTYGFADGHAEVHTESGGDFSGYEKDHTASLPPNQ